MLSRAQDQGRPYGSESTSDGFPLSPIQEGMLFHCLLDRNSGTDIEQIVVELETPINSILLAAAWQRVVARHEILRAHFRWEGLDRPQHVIQTDCQLNVSEFDWGDIDANRLDSEWASFLREDRIRGFDPAAAPLFRLSLFKLPKGQSRLLWTIHHILADGRGFVLILDEVFRELEGLPVPSRPVSYRAYIDWLTSQRLEGSGEFWKAKLRGLSSPTPLLHEPEPPTGIADRYGEMQMRLSSALSSQLREFCSTEHVTLNVMIQGAWALLLSRYSGESEVLFGVTKTTRSSSLENADSIIGLLISTLPMRVNFQPAEAVGGWLRKIREEWISLRPFEQSPLVQIKECCEFPARTALFDTLVLYESQTMDRALQQIDDSWASRHVEIVEQTNHELALLAYGDPEILLKLEYNAKRFRPETARLILGHLSTVLVSMAKDADGLIGSICILTAEERRRMLKEWNDTHTLYSDTAGVHELIAEQCHRTPDRIAVEDAQVGLTYAELNSRANQLGAFLKQKGIHGGDLVGICLDRSVDLVVTLLAVWKSGAAYVPLDPIYPRHRLAHMISDSGLKLIVTSGSVQDSLPDCSVGVIRVDEEQARIDALPTNDLDPDANSRSLAYVIYTSGSTGTPKGVLIEHRSLLNFLLSMRASPGMNLTDTVLAVTTISFDIATLELYLPLISGAKIVIASRSDVGDGLRLLEMVSRNSITFMQATPITWRLMLAAGWEETPGLKALCGGEPLSQELATELLKRVGSLWNMYGPTETTVWSTLQQVLAGQPITIGRPIANTTTYIVTPDHQPLPVGVTGELLIGGDGLARGYHFRPELTSDRFIELAVDSRCSERVYRTGDLARFCTDGKIECLGRVDSQVKIRGFRIELGEIESVLNSFATGLQSVVTVKEPRPGDKRLVAYMLGRPLSNSDLRQYLRTSLPEYMVPSDYIFLDSFPLTPNGKVDRKQLAARAEEIRDDTPGYIPPRSAVEQLICETMARVLSVTRVGIHENFFDLGGNSLLAVNLFLEIEETVGTRLSLNSLFNAATPAEIAAELTERGAAVRYGRHSIVTMRSTGRKTPIFWIPGGRAISALSFRETALLLGEDQPVYAFESTLPGPGDEPEQICSRAAAYLKCMRKVQPHGPYQLIGFCIGGVVAYEMATQLASEGEHVSHLGLVNSYLPGFGEALGARIRFRFARAQRRIRTEGPMTVLRDIARVLSKSRSSNNSDLDLSRNLGALTDGFRPVPYAGCLTIFISGDSEFTGISRDLDPRAAWLRSAPHSELLEIPGGHTTVLEYPYVKEFAKAIRCRIDATEIQANAK
jgi:amino acid adenylation domain-containing protein